MAKIGHYNTQGLYNKYDKNHKERDTYDYYSTPPEEVENILNLYKPNFTDCCILEPCAGEGHMAHAINKYITEQNFKNVDLICTEFQKRKNKFDVPIAFGEEYDFLSDHYSLPDKEVDWIIMNPPYSTIEPFMIRALEIAKKGIIMLGRIQCLEGNGRYENVFKNNPPAYVYTYVDRIQCWKNGQKSSYSSAQGYSWFIWDKENKKEETIHRWMRRI